MTQQTFSPVSEAIALQPNDDGLSPLVRIDEVLKRWHDDTHEGAYRWCQEQPCRAVRRVTSGTGS